METLNAQQEVLKAMSGVRAQELPSYRDAASKRASEELGDKMEKAARQGVRDSLEKAFGSAFHSQIATQPENHIRATEESAAALPAVDTSRGRFEPRFIAPATVKPGESGLQAAMARLRQESPDAKVLNTQQEWAPFHHKTDATNAADALPNFIVKTGSESLRCERCGIDFPAKLFGAYKDRPFVRAKKHVELCHTPGCLAESIARGAVTHDSASTVGKSASSDLRKSRPF